MTRRLPSLTGTLLGTALALAGCSEPPPPPAPPPVVVEAPAAPPPPTERVLTVRKKDTLGTLVTGAGLPPQAARNLVAALRTKVDPRRVRPGHQLALVEDAGGTLLRAEYRTAPCEAVELVPVGEAFEAREKAFSLTSRPERVAVTVDSSLFEAFTDAGEDPSLAMAVVDVLAWEIDFYRDVQPGDRLSMVVERTSCDGEPLRAGDVLAVKWEGAAGTKEFHRWDGPRGSGWFAPDGKSARKAFLKQPLPLVRITSRFGGRKHPTLGYWKQHQGVDYGAPTGTPVWSVGDGVVTHAGYKGANGNLVSVRHANGYTTHYAHLSRISVRAGQAVSQKQVVGAVGTTGRSTGPHLHFALSRGATFVNPLSVTFPAGDPLPAADRAAFAEAVAASRTLLLATPALVAGMP